MTSASPSSDPWVAIDGHDVARLNDLFDGDPDRLKRLSFDVGGIHFDWSKTHLDPDLIAKFVLHAAATGFDAKRDALFSGAIVNVSEGRAATHVAERGQGSPDDVAKAAALHQRMRSMVDAIE
ncbi:MAG: glucose-6-phosphate isomerase, partial [Sphingomicrobium sp.]